MGYAKNYQKIKNVGYCLITAPTLDIKISSVKRDDIYIIFLNIRKVKYQKVNIMKITILKIILYLIILLIIGYCIFTVKEMDI